MTHREDTPHGALSVGSLTRLKTALILAVVSLLAACDDLRFPRDVEGTLETVLSDKEMTVAASEIRHGSYSGTAARRRVSKPT